MRTTIEMTDEHRAKLLELAARRGENGFSSLVAEALELYIRSQEELDEARKLAGSARGSLRARDADGLREAVAHIRGDWR